MRTPKHWTISECVQRLVEQVMSLLHAVLICTNQTTVVTLVSAVTILLLVLFEVIRYMTPVMQSEIIVDGGIMVR